MTLFSLLLASQFYLLHLKTDTFDTETIYQKCDRIHIFC